MSIDMSVTYSVATYPGVAFRILGYATTEEYEGDQLVCEDEDCDHALSEMCWVEGSTSICPDTENVRAVMIGDDREHIICVDDLMPIDDEAYCSCCGQIGCQWN